MVLALIGVSVVDSETRALINLSLSWIRGEKFPDWSSFCTFSKTNSSSDSNIELRSWESCDDELVVACGDSTGYWENWGWFGRDHEKSLILPLFPSAFWTEAPGNGGKKRLIWFKWPEVFIVRGGNLEPESGSGNLKIFDPKCTKYFQEKSF